MFSNATQVDNHLCTRPTISAWIGLGRKYFTPTIECNHSITREDP